MWLPYKILFLLIHILSLPLHPIFFLVLFLYKQIVCLLAILFQDFVGPIPSSSHVFIVDRIWSKPHSSITVVFTLDRNRSIKDVTRSFQEGYDLKDKNGERCYRELGYYPVEYLGYGFWKQVTNFKINRIHILSHEQNENETHETISSSPSAEKYLQSTVQTLQRQPYEKGQPLWDVYLQHNFKGNQTLVIIRFHHLMSDGMSFVKFFYALTGSDELPESFTKPSTSLGKWNQIASSNLAKMGAFCSLVTVGVVDYINDVLIEQDRHALHFDENGKLKLTRNWICSNGCKLDVEKLKKASKIMECSIVHLLLVAISNGLEKYFIKYHGKKAVPEGFHYVAPLPMPHHPNMRFVNHWCIAKLYARMDLRHAAEKLQYFKDETKRCATSTLPIISAFMFQYVSGFLPRIMVDSMTKANATNTVILSNVVGPQDKDRTLLGAKLTDMWLWMPISQESIALGIGAISCNGGLNICLTADTGCIPEQSRLEDLGNMIDAELVHLCKLE